MQLLNLTLFQLKSLAESFQRQRVALDALDLHKVA